MRLEVILTAKVSWFGGEKQVWSYPAVCYICDGRCRLEFEGLTLFGHSDNDEGKELKSIYTCRIRMWREGVIEKKSEGIKTFLRVAGDGGGRPVSRRMFRQFSTRHD
jgi:hypothetical protein